MTGEFGKRRAGIFNVFVLGLALLAGCQSPHFMDGKAHKFDEIALVIDATVINERTLAPAQINVASDNQVAAQVEVRALETLGKYGYHPFPAVRTSGLGFSSDKPIEVIQDMSAPHMGPLNTPPYTVFMRMPGVNIAQLADLHRKPENARFVLLDFKGKPLPVMVITLRGKSTSAGSMLTNVARGAVNVVLSIGARDAVNVMEFDRDTVQLSISLIEGGSGQLLWQENRTVPAAPRAGAFEHELREMLKKFPRAERQK